ncbi:MAG: alpha-E domain-containing protein [Hyphomicrobiales bacterium]|nr:alpha-E domain-containing protein [Hyphomicrobiales bacterium]MDE2114451.1 alpha-E domain-containing protein [Hyphomicrobiales bacterium]
MLSRTANNLFWLARYMERADNLARVIDVASRLASLPSAFAGKSNEWEGAVASASCRDEFFEVYKEATRENVIEFLVAHEANPNSIRACIDTARGNARAVRTAMTSEMWETINDVWLKMQNVKLKDIRDNKLNDFLSSIKEASLRFDGAANRTMLRTDHFYFERLGMFIERADNTARLLDVKYHVLLPVDEPVGGGLDYFQWTSLLRSVSALTSFHWIYRETVKPWLVADFLILRREQPRSLIAIYDSINQQLNMLAELYGRQGPSQRNARAIFANLQNAKIEDLFQNGLHEFISSFIVENNKVGKSLAEQYLL